MRGGGEGVEVILFIPRTVSKHKIHLLPSKVCAIWYMKKSSLRHIKAIIDSFNFYS